MRQPSYKVLIVGCGNIGGGFDMARPSEAPPLTHAGAFSRHPGFELDACVDPDPHRRQGLAAHWAVPTAVGTMAELEGREGVWDVISICSPTALHGEHLEDALRLKPRLIFAEKPLTASLEESSRWVDACHARGVTLCVNHTRRWDPAIESLCEELGEGRWGPLRSVVAHYNKGILNNGGHMMDLLLRLVGPMKVVATAGHCHDFWPDDPTVSALLRATSTGVPVHLCAADARDYAFFELELVCALGIVRMHSGGMGWQIRRAVNSEVFSGYKTLGAVQEHEGRYPHAMSLAVADIFSHLSEGRAVASPGRQALEVQRLCHHILEAAMSSSASNPL